MFISKRRLIHAALYEGILLVVIAVLLSRLMDLPLELTGALGMSMTIIALGWNMLFNHYFEQIEARYELKRTVKIRIVHAIGFEGGMLLVTVPMVAYALDISLAQAFVLDLGLTLGILAYTVIFQWGYDHLEARMGLAPDYRKFSG
jgi:uncharacterized membrane protein